MMGLRPELLLALLTVREGGAVTPSLAAVAGGEGNGHGFLLLSLLASVPPSSAQQQPCRVLVPP